MLKYCLGRNGEKEQTPLYGENPGMFSSKTSIIMGVSKLSAKVFFFKSELLL